MFLRVLSWATQENTAQLKKRHLLLSGLLVFGLSFLVISLVQRHSSDPASKLGRMPVAHFAGGLAVVCIGAGLVGSGIIIAFSILCRWVGIVNLYASVLLLGVIARVVSIFAWDRLARGVGMFLLESVQVLATFIAVAWLSLKFSSASGKGRKEHVSQPARATDAASR